MESLLELLEPLTRLISTVVGIILFFIFMVRPLLNYLVVNHEIERLKKRQAAMMEADLAGELAEEGHEDEVAAGKTVSGRRPSQQDALSRLAASDPEKAGELVKKWVKSD